MMVMTQLVRSKAKSLCSVGPMAANHLWTLATTAKKTFPREDLKRDWNNRGRRERERERKQREKEKERDEWERHQTTFCGFNGCWFGKMAEKVKKKPDFLKGRHQIGKLIFKWREKNFSHYWTKITLPNFFLITELFWFFEILSGLVFDDVRIVLVGLG